MPLKRFEQFLFSFQTKYLQFKRSVNVLLKRYCMINLLGCFKFIKRMEQIRLWLDKSGFLSSDTFWMFYILFYIGWNWIKTIVFSKQNPLGINCDSVFKLSNIFEISFIVHQAELFLEVEWKRSETMKNGNK